jgi:hypothetical protein
MATGVHATDSQHPTSVGFTELFKYSLGSGTGITTDFDSLYEAIETELDAWVLLSGTKNNNYESLTKLYRLYLVGGKRTKARMFANNVTQCTVPIARLSVTVYTGANNPAITPKAFTFSRLCACLALWQTKSWPVGLDNIYPAMSYMFSPPTAPAAGTEDNFKLLPLYMVPGCQYMYNKTAVGSSSNDLIILACFIMDAKTINDEKKTAREQPYAAFDEHLLAEMAEMTTGSRLALARYTGTLATDRIKTTDFQTFWGENVPQIKLEKAGASMKNMRTATLSLTL